MPDSDGSDRASTRAGSVVAMVRVIVMRTIEGASNTGNSQVDLVAVQRRFVADYCKFLMGQVGGKADYKHIEPMITATHCATRPNGPDVGLPPRMQQTLRRLLAGDGEKQIARRLGVSKHTIHVYVKSLYRRFEVNSRGELLSQFVNASYREEDLASATRNKPKLVLPLLLPQMVVTAAAP